MLWVAGSGDAPEIEDVGAVVLGVDNHLDKEGRADHELAVGVVGGGVGVVAGAAVIVDEGSGDGEGSAGRVERGIGGELGDI